MHPCATFKRDVLSLKAAKSVLGWEDCKQPDWFVESYSKLHHLIIERNRLFQKLLKTQLPQDWEHFVSQHGYVAREVKVSTTSLVGGSGCHWWGIHALHNIQRGQAGLQPV